MCTEFAQRRVICQDMSLYHGLQSQRRCGDFIYWSCGVVEGENKMNAKLYIL